MNNMYDILAKMTLLEDKSKPDFLDLDQDGDQEESMKDAAQDVNEQDVAGEYPHRQSKTFGHSHNMAPGYDPTYADPLRMGFKNEIEELEHLLYSGGSNAELNRRTALARKYGLNSSEDLAKLPQLKQQMMRQISRKQQQLRAQSAEQNVAARDEDERQLARMQAAAGVKPAANSQGGQATFQGIKAPPGLQEGVDIDEASLNFASKMARAGKDSSKAADKKKSSIPRDEYGDPDDGSMFDPRTQRERESDSERHSDRHGRGREFAEDSTGVAGDLRDRLGDMLEMIRDQAAEGHDMTDEIADELGDIFDAVQASGDSTLQKAYAHIRKAADTKPQNQSDVADAAIMMLFPPQKPVKVPMKDLMARMGAPYGKKGTKRGIGEADMGEGNDFTGARLAAIRAGKPTFKVDGKVYKVTGDTSDEKVMEREMKDKTEFDRWAEPGDTYKGSKGTITKTASGITHSRRDDDEDTGSDDDYDQWGNRKAGAKKSTDGEKRGRGRPKGTKRAIGAKGPTGKSKLLNRSSIKEDDLEEDRDLEADAGEYGREGDMAKEQLHTIEAAAEELSSILSDEQDLPEWVQKKITLAKEYVDSARDYMLSQGDEGQLAEKAVSKAQRAAAGIAYAAKKGDIPKSELRGASKEMVKMPAGELKKFAKTKEKGLPEKKKEESVEETTTSGSVAAAPAEAPKGKKGMVFGKGVYEGRLEESYNSQLEQMLAEGINMSINTGDQGQNSVSVTATDEDAAKLSELLKMAGLFSSGGYSAVDTDDSNTCEACGGHEGMHEAGCSQKDMVEEELANSPDETYADMDTILNKLAGGLNGPKRQINPNNMGDNPMAMTKLGKGPASLNLGETMQQVQEETEQRLADLYKNYKG